MISYTAMALNMLQKDNFVLIRVAKKAFQALKITLAQATILALPNFTKQLIIENK